MLRVKYTKEFLVSELRRIHKSLGRTPKTTELRKFNAPNKTTYVNYFGNYANACIQAGIPTVRATRRRTDDEVLQELRRVYEELERPISREDFTSNNGNLHYSAIEKRFGGFHKACRLASVPSNSIRGCSDSKLIEDLKNAALELKRPPISTELPKYGLATDITYRTKFGSYTNALHLAGISNINHSSGSYRGVRCFASDGTICNSLAELQITEFLIKHGIQFTKEKHYPNSQYRTDWGVNGVFIEYFGLAGKPKYDKKIEIKKRICSENGIELIEIYPKDLPNFEQILLDRFIRPHTKSVKEVAVTNS